MATKPTITKQPISKTIFLSANTTTVFTVAASGSPAPSYQWEYLQGTQWTTVPNGTGNIYKGSSNTNTLTITNPKITVSGTKYRCLVINSAGYVRSNEVIVTIIEHVAVTNITGVPTTATAGKALALPSTVSPTNASNKAIVWSVYTTKTTGATISGNVLSTTAAGTVTVRATIKNGKTATTDYTQDFTITVAAAFVAVTNITGVPATATAGKTVTLTGTITPTTATNKTIVWSVVSAGTTGATISGSVLSVRTAGKVTVRATIKNGKTATTDYTQDFTITVNPVAVTNITSVPTTATAGKTVTLAGTVSPTTATNKTIVWSVYSAGTTGATISGNILSTKTAGTVTVRATIKLGKTATTDYTQDFKITVNPIAVTNITGVPTTAMAGKTVALTGTVSPTTATNKTIVWNVYSAGSTGATISGNVLSVKTAGTVIVRATITLGKTATENYTQNFEIAVDSTVLTLDKTVFKVKEEYSNTLKVIAGNTSKQTLLWSSSNTNVVTVDTSGNCTGGKKGIADIIVKTADGKQQASCKVYVYTDIITSLGRGINIVDSEAIISDYIRMNNPVIDIDMLNAMGQVKQEDDPYQDIDATVRSSVLEMVNSFSQKSSASYDGLFSASVDVNYDTTTTTKKTSKFVKVEGYRRIRTESIMNTNPTYLKTFLTEQFIIDCNNKTADELLDIYGSHIIAECCWGGKAIANAMYTGSRVIENKTLEVTAKASFGGFKTDNETTRKEDKDYFIENTTEKISAWGGNEMTGLSWEEFASRYKTWFDSITNKTACVCGLKKDFNESSNMIPLWKFVEVVSSSKATAVEALFRKICSDRGIALKGFKIYHPVVTSLSLFYDNRASAGPYKTVQTGFTHAVLKNPLDRDNDAENVNDKDYATGNTDEDKRGKFMDILRGSTGWMYMFYEAKYSLKNRISEIVMLKGKDAKTPAGYTKMPTDLNSGNKGTASYLAYKPATSSDEYVIDFIGGQCLKNSSLTGFPSAESDGKWEWLCEHNGTNKTEKVADMSENAGCGYYPRLVIHKIKQSSL